MLEEFTNASNKAKTAVEKLLQGLESDFTEEILKILLTSMSLIFVVNSKYRMNIENFHGTYLFRSKDNAFSAAAVFKNGKMEVLDGAIDNPNIAIIFKNPRGPRGVLSSHPSQTY